MKGQIDHRPAPGAYALVLFCPGPAAIHVGRLGELRFRRGYYIYLGSALGPGGVRARVAHHERLAMRPRWHIDYLRRRARLEEVWYSYGPDRREHEWAAVMKAAGGIPVRGFGASDCGCESHLYFFRHRPSRGTLARQNPLAAHPTALAQSFSFPARVSKGPGRYNICRVSMRFEGFLFGSIRIDGVTYEHDVVIDREKIQKRKKKPSKKYRDSFGHTPLSIEEAIPWKCRRLVIGTGTGQLPVMKEVKAEARRRKIKLLILPTAEAIEELRKNPDETNAILHVTC